MGNGDTRGDEDGSARRSSVRFRTMRTLVHGLDPGDDEMVGFVADTLNDPRVFQTYSDEGREPLTRADVREMFAGDDAYAFVARERGSDDFIGVVEVSRLDRRSGSALVGNFLPPEYRGQKYGKEIPLPIVDWLFQTVRCHRVWSLAGENADPNGLVGTWGFEREGVLRDADYIDGEYVDRHVIACLEDDWAAAKRERAEVIERFKPSDAVYPQLPDDALDAKTNGHAETDDIENDTKPTEPPE